MSRTSEQLKEREQTLEQEGADPLRIELLRRARRFKRSWIEMAEALLQLRDGRDYEQWGYGDLYEYCAQELLIKRRTVDKLTSSFTTLKQHAPAFLEEDGAEANVPSCDAVDYFARVLGDGGRAEERAEPPPEALDDLHQAVFEEARPVTALRRQFNPIFFAKSDEQLAVDAMVKANAAAQRLAAMLAEINGLSDRRVAEVEAALEGLRGDLEGLIPPAQERLQATG
jgi:hypothetical protein